MGDMIPVAFDEIFPEILTPLERTIQREIRGPILCRHEHCKKPLEKLHDEWYHIDGTRKCRATYAEPEDD